jgi:hypothetical protein
LQLCRRAEATAARENLDAVQHRFDDECDRLRKQADQACQAKPRHTAAVWEAADLAAPEGTGVAPCK